MTTIPTQVGIYSEVSRVKSWTIILILLVGALLLRALLYPTGGCRNGAEPMLNTSGLSVMEGMTPSFKEAPGAPVVWTGWGYALCKSIGHYFNPESPEASLPAKARFTGAINAALFDIYRDQSGLRNVQLIEAIFFGLLLVYAATCYGMLRGGSAGGWLLGSVTAFYPLYVNNSLLTLPYIHAWALAALALFLAAAGGGQKRRWAYILLGAAVSARLEMVLFMPLLLWESWPHLPERKLFQAIKYFMLSVIVALTLAPWVLMSLLTVTGMILRDRRLTYLYGDLKWNETIDAVAIAAGLAPSFFLLLLGLAMGIRWKQYRKSFLCLTIIVVVIVLTGWNSLHNYTALQAPILLTILMLSVYGIRAMGQAWQPIISLVAIVVAAVGIYATCYFSEWRTPAGNDQNVAQYIEEHIVPGSVVYWDARTSQTILPTQWSADAIWYETLRNEWRRKLGWIMDSSVTALQSSIVTAEPPRAMTLDMIQKEMSVARSNFILGGRPQLTTPRFDLWPRLGLGFRGLIPLDVRYKRDGGVYVVTTSEPPDDSLGTPLQTFNDPGNAPTYIYVSDLKYVLGKKPQSSQPTTKP